ncbi:helix-turn-helix domain-containing protein [Streptococcus pluranimalium]
MDKTLELISKQLRDIRKIKGITQQELAELTDLSVPYISQIENNKTNLTLETFLRLTQALDISLSTFFEPYSNSADTEITELIVKIKENKHSKELAKEILKVIELSKY